MTLTMKPGKTPVIFEYDDGVVSSSVKLLPADDEATLIAKLRRVIALAAEGRALTDFPQAELRANVLSAPRPVDAGHPDHGAMAAVPPGAVTVTNGWAAYAAQAPEIPERLRGEVELIEGGE